MKYEVGTHNNKSFFDCLECAENFYNELGDCKKYLIKLDWFKKIIIYNTYGWKNE